jgi:nitroimidazol reductase NimA-like FMN-containing flavoprotein (pyridoxamine 5'-phosphate oxidase superfamily)
MNLTKRTELGRIPCRGSHDWETISPILDAGFLAHVGFCVDGQPFVIPTLYGRDGAKRYLHGSAASRMLEDLETGIPACVTVTLVDGLVLSRSAFDPQLHSLEASLDLSMCCTRSNLYTSARHSWVR